MGLVAWLHAVLQERLRYAPIGWTKLFEFNEADQRCAFDTIDYWIENKAQGRTNLPPSKIPWQAIRSLFAETVYGGRVDNPFDQRLLESFLDHLFTVVSFEDEFNLTSSKSAALIMPPAKTKAQYEEWIEKLPDTETPTWLGLADNAETVLLVNQGKAVLSRLHKMHSLEEDTLAIEEETAVDDQADSSGAGPLPAWSKSIDAIATAWLDSLPKEKLLPLEITAANQQNPLWRFFDRELQLAIGMLNRITNDLKALKQVCVGELKQTNYLRALISSISKGVVPKSWNKYSIPETISVKMWFIDFVERLKQLAHIRSRNNFTTIGTVWLGGLFQPEAFITATRQAAARAHSWSLENLVLNVTVLDKDSAKETQQDSFIVKDMAIQACGWNSETKVLTTAAKEVTANLPPVYFQWVLAEDQKRDAKDVTLPLYLNESRTDALLSLAIPADAEVPKKTWFQRGAAILAWKSSL